VLEVAQLHAGYGSAQVLRGVSLRVPAGSVLAVVGRNGAGKTTLARAVVGLHPSTGGAIRVGGRALSPHTAVAVARSGVAFVPQGRRLFGSLTVAEHFAIARTHRRPRAMSTDELIELFPRLGERARVRGRSLSGGEQQMVAIARAVLAGPDVLVLDEPTEGLAPVMVAAVRRLIDRLRTDGVAVLLMEQSGGFPFEVADDVLAIDRGVIRSVDRDVIQDRAGQAHDDRESGT